MSNHNGDSLKQFGFRLRQYSFHKGVKEDSAQVAIMAHTLRGCATQLHQMLIEGTLSGREPPEFD